jgi:DNA-directed RNA polymerase specialized sigma24 family protein
MIDERILPSDEDLLRSELWRFSRVWRGLGLDYDDLAQDVRLAMLQKPTRETLPAHRRLIIRQRLIDVLRVKGYRASQRRYTGVKAAFNLMPAWADLDLQDPTHEPVPPDPWLHDRLHAALAALPARQRDVVVRHVVEGETLTDLARAHQRSLPWAWSQKTRGLAALKEALCV